MRFIRVPYATHFIVSLHYRVVGILLSLQEIYKRSNEFFVDFLKSRRARIERAVY